MCLLLYFFFLLLPRPLYPFPTCFFKKKKTFSRTVSMSVRKFILCVAVETLRLWKPKALGKVFNSFFFRITMLYIHEMDPPFSVGTSLLLFSLLFRWKVICNINERTLSGFFSFFEKKNNRKLTNINLLKMFKPATRAEEKKKKTHKIIQCFSFSTNCTYKYLFI